MEFKNPNKSALFNFQQNFVEEKNIAEDVKFKSFFFSCSLFNHNQLYRWSHDTKRNFSRIRENTILRFTLSSYIMFRNNISYKCERYGTSKRHVLQSCQTGKTRSSFCVWLHLFWQVLIWWPARGNDSDVNTNEEKKKQKKSGWFTF